jgi:hypothetical protein
MRVKNLISVGLTACAALALVITNQAKAQDPVITMALGDFSTYADEVNLGNMTIPGDPTEAGYIGIYSFNVSSSTTPNVPVGTFWTTCLSPAGEIDAGSPPANYNYETFSEANSGINPPAWAWNGLSGNPQYWGIQNANYLWEQVMGNNSQPNLNADQSTALALALYAALYNSMAYGTLGGSKFDPNFGTSGTFLTGNVGDVQNYYYSYLALLNPTAVEDNLANGYVLVPTPQEQNGYTYGQEFIFMAPEGANVSVPESAGMGICAGVGCLIFSLRYCRRRALV